MLRKHWMDLGMLVALAAGIHLTVNWSFIPEIQGILWLSFIAILFHQFEEYRWPGYFGGLFNVVIFKSEHPERYPLNAHSAMVVNLIIAYVFYLVPVLFPNVIWLGLAPILMGFFQLIWHGLFANIKAKTIYNPGLLAVLSLHIPVGAWYIYVIGSQGLATSADWIAGTLYFAAAVYILIIKGNMWMKDKDSRYSFTKKQLGPYAR